MKKNLIYYTVGFNSNYVDMLDLHLKSLEKFNDGSFDCMVITDNRMSDIVKSKVTSHISLNYHISDANNMVQASVNKLKIHEYKNISDYNCVLFCDIDSMWNGSPSDIFKEIKDDKIYVANEPQLMCHSSGSWGNYYLTPAEREDITDKNIMGINGGSFAFKSSMASIFCEIEKFVYSKEPNFNSIFEQSFLNVYLYRNNLIDNILNKFVLICFPNDGFYTDKHLIHFVGGDNEIKITKMKGFLSTRK